MGYEASSINWSLISDMFMFKLQTESWVLIDM